MAILTNQNGTSGADTLTYNKAGTYHAGAGNDTIKIEGGSGIVVYTDSGNNIVNVTGGSGHTVKVAVNDADSEKQNGVEKLAINGANQVDAYLGSGKDEILLRYSDGRKSNGALSQIHGGGWTDTFTVGNGAQRYQLYGDAGDDIFNISSGSNIVCWGGAANDTFNVTGGTGIKLRGGDSADIYKISVGGVDMQLGYGNDEVYVSGGDKQLIKANLGINTINLNAGSGHIITSDIDQAASKKAGHDVGYGVDKVNIIGASNVTANLGEGKDIVKVNTGSGHKIYTEGWGDTIEIGSNVANSIFDAGLGDDIIEVQGGNNNVVKGGSGDDQLKLSGIVVGGRFEGGTGADTITVAGSGMMVYGDHSSWMDYEMDPLSSVYGDTINVIKTARNCTIDAGRGVDIIKVEGDQCLIRGGDGGDTITMDTTNANEVYGDGGNDTINVDKTYFYQSKAYTKNAYAKISGGAGNDIINVTADYSKYDAGDALVVFGGSGNDTFNLDCQNVIAYGGKGNDSFINTTGNRYYGNNMMGGAGNDTYIFDLGHGMYKDDTTFRIDNRTYRESTDKDELRIDNFEGSIDSITLKSLGDDKYETRRMELRDSQGRVVCLIIDGFQALNSIRIHYKGDSKYTNYGTGTQFEQLLSEKGKIIISGIETKINWDTVYKNHYSESMEATFGTFENFIARDSDLKITGNAF